MKTTPLANKKYNVIYADPPWKYVFSATSSRAVTNHYSVMDVADICKLPVSQLAADNCVLLMWATFPKLEEAMSVIGSWGFEYKTTAFTWVKKNKKSDSLFWGMGYYTRSNAEICLLATKGKPLPRLSHSVHSIINEPIERHSKKPDIVRDKIVELFGDIPRVELFARQATPGWDIWGNEVESDIAL